MISISIKNSNNKYGYLGVLKDISLDIEEA